MTFIYLNSSKVNKSFLRSKVYKTNSPMSANTGTVCMTLIRISRSPPGWGTSSTYWTVNGEHPPAQHAPSVQAALGGKKPDKFPRLAVGVDETSEKWENFQTSWAQYKDEQSLQGLGLTRQ